MRDWIRRQWPYILCFLLFVGVGILSGVLFLSHPYKFGADWGVVSATLILAGITAWYGWNVRESVQEMRRARQIEHQAELIFNGEYHENEGTLILYVSNYGLGSARDIRMDIIFAEGDSLGEGWGKQYFSCEYVPKESHKRKSNMLSLSQTAQGKLRKRKTVLLTLKPFYRDSSGLPPNTKPVVCEFKRK